MSLKMAPSYQVIDKVGMPHVLGFICARLERYDTSQLDWVKLLPLNRHVVLHGCCHFPYRERADGPWRHGYRIRASVNVDLAPPFVYRHWARTPSSTNARGWVSGEYDFEFEDLEQCAVHTLAHECFHFLADSGQVDERNTEANANWWADGWLKAFCANHA